MTIPVTPDMIAAAWSEWKPRNPRRLGPGPGFVEAVGAAIAAAPVMTPKALAELLLNQFERPNGYAFAIVDGDLTSVVIDETYDLVEIAKVILDRFAIPFKPIRQLEWTTPTCGPDEYLTIADAAPCEFRYEIDNGGNTAKPYRIKRTCNIQVFGWALSIEAAKACAQRDFQQRIISAFV